MPEAVCPSNAAPPIAIKASDRPSHAVQFLISMRVAADYSESLSSPFREILAVVQRLYRGKLDRPKSERSQRTVALSSTTRTLLQQWRPPVTDPEAWVFPSARTTTPLGRHVAAADRAEIKTHRIRL